MLVEMKDNVVVYLPYSPISGRHFQADLGGAANKANIPTT